MDGEIDELRARVASLEAALARERALFAGGPVVVFRWVAADGWPVEYVSDNVEALFGYSVTDLLSGRVRYADLVHPDDVQRVGDEVAAHTAAGVTSFEQDYRIVNAGGEVRWLYDFTVVLRDASDEVTHYAGYVLDISARRQAEAEVRRKDELLRQSQKMEALGRLAGGISHDFNNLLTAILGHVELAQAHLAPASPAFGPLERVGSLIDRASALTHQLLAFARRQVLEPRVTDLSELVEDARGLIAPLLGEQVVLEARLDPDRLWVRVDPSQLEQVVVNLLLNARDSMQGAGRIVVRTSAVTLDETLEAVLDDTVLPGDYAVLFVCDEGTGLDPGAVPRIFEPFFTTKEQGTGLGLATVYGIVRQSHGHVRVRIEEGATSFEVWLPRHDAPATPGPRPPVVVRGPLEGGEHVLVVEDHDEIRSIVHQALTARGYTVTVARDGAEALALVRDDAPPDVVITDLVMPRMGGAALVEALDERGLRLPVLFVSGYARTALPSWPDRVHAVVHKPFTAETLLRALRGLLEG